MCRVGDPKQNAFFLSCQESACVGFVALPRRSSPFLAVSSMYYVIDLMIEVFYTGSSVLCP
jgi:hypothetical protein